MKPGNLCTLVLKATTWKLIKFNDDPSHNPDGCLCKDEILLYIDHVGLFYRLLTSTGVRLIAARQDILRSL